VLQEKKKEKKGGKKKKKKNRERGQESDSTRPVGKGSRGGRGMRDAREVHAGSNIVWVSLFARLTSGRYLLGVFFFTFTESDLSSMLKNNRQNPLRIDSKAAAGELKLIVFLKSAFLGRRV